MRLRRSECKVRYCAKVSQNSEVVKIEKKKQRRKSSMTENGRALVILFHWY